MKKRLAVLSLTLILTFLFSGCVSILTETNVNVDGSGNIAVFMGVAKDAYDNYVKYDDKLNLTKSLGTNELQEYTYKGVTYLGKTETSTFNSLDEFNKLMSNYTKDRENKKISDFMQLRMEWTPGHAIKTSIGMYPTSQEEMFGGYSSKDDFGFDIDTEQYRALMSELAYIIEINYPVAVHSFSDREAGIKINKNKLTLDVLRMSDGLSDSKLANYIFITDVVSSSNIIADVGDSEDGKNQALAALANILQGGSTGNSTSNDGTNATTTTPSTTETKTTEPAKPAETKEPESTPTPVVKDSRYINGFKDVIRGEWYSSVIESLNNSGMMVGMGDGYFEPNGLLTYSQFCTMLSRYLSCYDTSTESPYWAAYALRGCINEGFIASRGDITAKNYEVPISREEATAALVRASKKLGKTFTKNNITASNIPDFEKISLMYRDEILMAYNGDITHGIDSNMTFSPQSTLTRAQMCQFFFNLGWTVPGAGKAA